MTARTFTVELALHDYEAIASGERPFHNIRQSAQIQRGDLLTFVKMDENGRYCVNPPGASFGRVTKTFEVTWVSHGEASGLKPDWCSVGLRATDELAVAERQALLTHLAANLTGASASSMLNFLLTGKRDKTRFPIDGSDFARCEAIFLAAPSLRDRIPELATLGVEWAAIAQNWDEILVAPHRGSAVRKIITDARNAEKSKTKEPA